MVYCLGYEKKEISLMSTDSFITIVLQQSNTELNGVSVVAGDKKVRNGVLGKADLVQHHKSGNGIGYEEGVFLQPKHENAFLKEVYFYLISEHGDDPAFRIHVYDNDSLPVRDITGDTVIVYGSKGNEWIRVDLSALRIPISGGVFIAVEWLDYGLLIGLTRSYGDRIFSYNRSLYMDDWRSFAQGYTPMIYGTYSYTR